jgi:hypothetical protein
MTAVPANASATGHRSWFLKTMIRAAKVVAAAANMRSFLPLMPALLVADRCILLLGREVHRNLETVSGHSPTAPGLLDGWIKQLQSNVIRLGNKSGASFAGIRL